MMKTEAIRALDKKEIKQQILKLAQERFNLRMAAGDGTTIKYHRFGEIRREIARMKTILSEKE